MEVNEPMHDEASANQSHKKTKVFPETITNESNRDRGTIIYDKCQHYL